MSPLIKKTLFRMKKLERPLKTNGEKKKHLITKELRRAIVGLFMLSLVIACVYSNKSSSRLLLHEGDVATSDVYAPFDFTYSAGIDEVKTKQKELRAASLTPDVYILDDAVYERSRNNCTELFQRLIAIGKAEEEAGVKLEPIDITGLGINLSESDLNLLIKYSDKTSVKQDMLTRLKKAYELPLISSHLKKQLLSDNKDHIYIYDRASKKESLYQLKNLDSELDIRSKIESTPSTTGIKNKNMSLLANNIVSLWVIPNLKLDSALTAQKKSQAQEEASPVYKVAEMSKGEVVVRKGQRVLKEQLIQMNEINKMQAETDAHSHLLGIVIIVALLAFLMFVYLKLFETKIFYDDKLLLIVGIVIFLSALSARIVVLSPLPSYFIPIASASMLVTLLVSGSVAAIVVVLAAVIVTLIAGIRFDIFLVSLIAGISAICTIYKARSRNSIIRSGLIIGSLNFIAICAIGIISNFDFIVFVKEALWGLASGFASAALVMLLLPLFESIFKITTDIKLLELSDLNHPLLKEMVTKATGTYHHSMVVGNLAESAADAIGANSLLARVGSYYHDIGKIEKSEYFAENKQVPSDVHEKLSPSMSSLIITNHVKDAMELAEKHKLGSAIKDIVQQHHGTGLVTYFYHQAVEKTQPEDPISEENFRYPGPKPQTKESAIVMLADSVEAASRVLPNPTPQRLKELVRKIINYKFLDRQLDECDLTLMDINNISESFVKILTGIYHSRIEYPTQKPTRHGTANNKRPKEDKA